MSMNRGQRTSVALAVIATSLVLELAIQLDWSQELTGWAVAGAIGLTLAARALLADRRGHRSSTRSA